MTEPKYVDDPFEDTDLSVNGQNFHNEDLCKRAFWKCGRKRNQFRSDAEVMKWRRIDKAVHQGKIPVAWIEDRFVYCEKYRWGLPQLMSSILNVAKMEDWIRENVRSTEAAPETRSVAEEPRGGVASNE